MPWKISNMASLVAEQYNKKGGLRSRIASKGGGGLTSRVMPKRGEVAGEDITGGGGGSLVTVDIQMGLILWGLRSRVRSKRNGGGGGSFELHIRF